MNFDSMLESRTDQDCAVCLQKCQHPTQLPCGHVFCFLCVKGVAFQSRKCAMCRSEIPVDYLDNPVLLEVLPAEYTDDNSDQKYQWYYEGRNGWWKYDERSNNELESAFSAGETNCILLLAGSLYVVDFQALTQVRRSDQTRKRRVKRDTPQFPAKGIAGIKSEKRQVLEAKNDDEENLNNANNQSETENSTIIHGENITIILPDEPYGQGLGSPNDRVVDYVVDRFGVIHLDDDDIVGEETEDIN